MLFRLKRNSEIEDSGVVPCEEWIEVLAIEPRALGNPESSGHGDWCYKTISTWYICRTEHGLVRIPDGDLWAAIDRDEWMYDE